MTTEQAPPPLSPVWEKVIDRATLTQLFTELQSHARILSVREKGGAMQYAGEELQDFGLLQTRLVTGATHAVQVRYLYDGQEWCDTLLRAHDGWKLLRMKQA
jgi:hypothetical protein